MAKSKYKLLHKVAEECDLNTGEMIYLDIGSQNKPSYVGSKNWILIQDSYTKQKLSFFKRAKKYLAGKFTRFLKKMNTMRENVKILYCDNAGKTRLLKKIMRKHL